MDFTIKAQANNEAELFIYGPIGREDNNPTEFITQLKAINANTLHIHINSPGGDMFAGHAIYGMIKNFKGKKITHIDGLAASAASIIAMAGDEIVMPKNTLLMIHNASTIAYGDSQEFSRVADNLVKMNQTMQAVYAAKTKLPPEQITAMMDKETWLTAAEAKELGFIDTVTNEIELDSYFDNENQLVINDIKLGNINNDKVKSIFAPKVVNAVATNAEQAPQITNKKELKPMDINALKIDHPELYAQIESSAYEKGKTDGINAERSRIKAIEDIGINGHERLIIDAKFQSGITAETLAMKILNAEKVQRQNFLANRQEDAGELNDIQSQAQFNQNSTNLPADFMAGFVESANKGRIKDGQN